MIMAQRGSQRARGASWLARQAARAAQRSVTQITLEHVGYCNNSRFPRVTLKLQGSTARSGRIGGPVKMVH